LIWDDVAFIAIAKNPDSFVTDHGGPVDLSNKWFEEKRSFIIPDSKINVHHHLAHHAAAFYTSPFESSIGFSLDCSSGQPETSYINSLITVGQENLLEMVVLEKDFIVLMKQKLLEKQMVIAILEMPIM